MIQMDMPHVNVLSKIDKVHTYDSLPFNLDYYTDVDDLTYLTPYLEAESPAMRTGKFSKLNEAISNMIDSYGLVRYEVLAVENKKSMMHLLRVVEPHTAQCAFVARTAEDAERGRPRTRGVGGHDQRHHDDRDQHQRRGHPDRQHRAGGPRAPACPTCQTCPTCPRCAR